MKIISYSLLCGIALGLMSCQDDKFEMFGDIHGIVLDSETADPIPNATIMISPGGKSDMTDIQGKFEFTELDILQYTLVVQKSGYVTNRKTIDVLGGGCVETNIILEKIK